MFGFRPTKMLAQFLRFIRRSELYVPPPPYTRDWIFHVNSNGQKTIYSGILSAILLSITIILYGKLFFFSSGGYGSGISLFTSPALKPTISLSRGDVEPSEGTYTKLPASFDSSENYFITYVFPMPLIDSAMILQAQSEENCWSITAPLFQQTYIVEHLEKLPIVLLITRTRPPHLHVD